MGHELFSRVVEPKVFDGRRLKYYRARPDWSLSSTSFGILWVVSDFTRQRDGREKDVTGELNTTLGCWSYRRCRFDHTS